MGDGKGSLAQDTLDWGFWKPRLGLFISVTSQSSIHLALNKHLKNQTDSHGTFGLRKDIREENSILKGKKARMSTGDTTTSQPTVL